jgi:hypothetical protein
MYTCCTEKAGAAKVPKREAYVLPLSGLQIRELIEPRTLLEQRAASVALARRSVPVRRHAIPAIHAP